MPVPYRMIRSCRAALRVGVVACTAASLGLGSAALAQTRATSPTYVLAKANFGIAPGAGFFVNNPDLRRGLDDFKTLGVHWIRSALPWKNFEPADPNTVAPSAKWNWKAVDAFVATMHEPAYNGVFDLIVTIDSPPAWATAPSRVAADGCPQPAPFDLQSYADAAAALAQHLQGTASVFELQNSPNIGVKSAAAGGATTSWPVPDPCGYTQLLKLTYPEIHAVRSDATVLVGGIGGPKDVPGERIAADEFLAALYQDGAEPFFDAVSYHPYSTPRLPCDPNAPTCVYDPSVLSAKKAPYGMTNGWDRMLSARNIMVANGDAAKQIWITEFGGPTNGPASATILSQADQGALLTAGIDRASQYPWVAETCWYSYQDQPGANPATTGVGYWMGVVNANFSHKLAFATYQNLTASAQ